MFVQGQNEISCRACSGAYGVIVMKRLTERCVVRHFREEDLDAFMAYRNDAAWMQFQGFKGLTREAYRKVLLGEASLFEGRQLAVADRETDSLLGDLYVRQEGDFAWIGYTISPAHARKGYASEAVTALLEWLAENGIAEVKAGVAPDNAPSVRLLEKLGFYFREATADGELIYIRRLFG